MKHTYDNIGQQIRTLRKAHNMTIEQLSEKIGKSDNSVGKIERKKNLPSVQTLLDICNCFNLGIDYFLKDDLAVYKSENAPNYAEKHAVLKFNNLFAEKQKVVMDIVSILLNV